MLRERTAQNGALVMANAISNLWSGIVDDLNANKKALGIGSDTTDGAEKASTGKITKLAPPSVAVWLQPLTPEIMSQNGAVYIKLEVYLYCIAAPAASEDDALDSAIDIALSVQKHLTNKVIAGATLQQPDDAASLEVTEHSSTGSIIGVLFYTEVKA
jgi:hypothetical protein